MIIDFKNFYLDQLFAKNDFEQQVVNFLKSWFSLDPFLSVQTSGSTGKPNTIEVEKERMLRSAKMTCNFLKLNEGDSALVCLPVNYISGQMMVVRAIERKLILYVENSSLRPLKNVTGKIEFCAMTPLQVENSLDKIHFIKKLIIGGAKVSEDLADKIRLAIREKSSASEVFETYGMSETLSHIALKEIAPQAESYFTAFDNIKISQNSEKCLTISAPQLNPKILQTNDIVDIKGENQFKFIGRADFIINSGGLKISPELLENLIKEKIDKELVFIGIQDELLGEKLVLVIEGKEELNFMELLSKITYPTKNHQPKDIVFLANFPRSDNGKILRREIKKEVEKLIAK